MNQRALSACLLAVAVACRGGDALDARDSAFVTTMIELKRLPPGTADTAVRNAVIRRHGFTVRSLESAAAELAANPARAAEVWARIDNPPPVPAPAAGAGAPPGGSPRKR